MEMALGTLSFGILLFFKSLSPLRQLCFQPWQGGERKSALEVR